MRALISAFLNNQQKILKLPRGWDIRFSPRFLTYTPTFDVHVETSKYTLVTAKTTQDLMNVFELRHKIFLQETGAGTEADNDGFDVDEFDSICDHIIIKENENNEIVGTYRVISSLYSDDFYSQTEFDLDQFLCLQGEKLELGRACIHADHRNGAVIDLLWRGIAEYIKLTNTKYLFGCSSVKTIDPRLSKSLMAYLDENHQLEHQHGIKPIGKFFMNLTKVQALEIDSLECKKLIPPLLRSYFSAGAKVYGEPAVDVDFKCIDFLTILDVNHLSPSYRKRYFKN